MGERWRKFFKSREWGPTRVFGSVMPSEPVAFQQGLTKAEQEDRELLKKARKRNARRRDVSEPRLPMYGLLYRVILQRIEAERAHHLALDCLSLLMGNKRLQRALQLFQIRWCPTHWLVWTPYDHCPACNRYLRTAAHLRKVLEAALNAADEERRGLAQPDPEGQEYVYRVCWQANGETWRGRLVKRLGVAVRQRDDKAHLGAWVERALLGDWKRVG